MPGYLPGHPIVPGVVILDAVARGANGDTIVTRLGESIDAVFLPRPLIFLDHLPRNETGKLPQDRLDTLWKAYRPEPAG